MLLDFVGMIGLLTKSFYLDSNLSVRRNFNVRDAKETQCSVNWQSDWMNVRPNKFRVVKTSGIWLQAQFYCNQWHQIHTFRQSQYGLQLAYQSPIIENINIDQLCMVEHFHNEYLINYHWYDWYVCLHSCTHTYTQMLNAMLTLRIYTIEINIHRLRLYTVYYR